METFDGIGQWALASFGPGKPLACYAKLAEEFGEVARPLQKQQYDKAIYELADMVIVLSHMAASLGLDLQRAVDEKMAVNRARTWARTPEGTYVHVEAKHAIQDRDGTSTQGSTQKE
jgi:NTP pyrophosphatase (non-canonical NTP hydrolase)